MTDNRSLIGDILIHLGHDFSKVTAYRQELDIDRAVHQASYEYNGVRYQRSAFASHPDGVIVIYLTADKPAAYTGRIQLADMHQARIAAAGNKLSSVGKLENGFEYEAQLLVLNDNGTVAAKEDDACANNPWEIAVPAVSLAFEQCDSVTLILSAGTNFLQDHTRQWLGAHPHAAVTKRVDAAAKQDVKDLLARHVKDYQSLFRRFSLDLGTTAPDLLAKTTLARLEAYAKSTTADPDLEALLCQFGRYLLISCSRPGSLPANLQGVWNDSNEPAWAGDYHSNINLEMNLFTNMIEAADVLGDDKEFRDHIAGLRDKLLKPKVGRWGQLQEWEEDKDDPKDDHRHVSHLFALYPGRQITRATTPDLSEAARVSLNARGDASNRLEPRLENQLLGQAVGWRPRLHLAAQPDQCRPRNENHLRRQRRRRLSEPVRLPSAVPDRRQFRRDRRLLRDAGAKPRESGVRGQGTGVRRQGTGAGHPTAARALPKAWPAGKVTGLCARGGFEVDMTWKDGHLTEAVIHSKSGLPCKVVCGDKTWEIHTTAGKSYPLTLANK